MIDKRNVEFNQIFHQEFKTFEDHENNFGVVLNIIGIMSFDQLSLTVDTLRSIGYTHAVISESGKLLIYTTKDSQ